MRNRIGAVVRRGLLVVAFAAITAHAQVFKCVAPDGRTSYQSEPCAPEAKGKQMEIATPSSDLDAVKRLLEANEASSCELMALDYRMRNSDPASPEGQATARELQAKMAEMERRSQAMWPQWVAAIEKVKPEDRATLERYSREAGERCATRICGSPACLTTVRHFGALPVPAMPRPVPAIRPGAGGVQASRPSPRQ